MIRYASYAKSKRLTKANSVMFGDTIFYIAKKNYDEKPIKIYSAYTYPEGICVAWNQDKEALKDWVETNIDRIELALEALPK